MKLSRFIFTLLVFICFTLVAVAQKSNSSDYILTNDSIRNTETKPAIQSSNRIHHPIQCTGKSFNIRDIQNKTFNVADLQNTAAKDINQIANTVSGIQYRVGEPLFIRGTSQGTAYYVDGVRIYGALPILLK